MSTSVASIQAQIPATLRADVALFEQWAKEAQWPALAVGLPLLLGLQPAAWPQILQDIPPARTLASAFADALELPLEPDAPVAPHRLRAAAERLGIVVPTALAQLMDCLGRVLPQTDAPGSAAESEALAAQERETLLGIALMLVTRMPRECLDEDGYFSADRICDLILQKSVRWFPLAPPTLGREGIRALIASWIKPGA